MVRGDDVPLVDLGDVSVPIPDSAAVAVRPFPVRRLRWPALLCALLLLVTGSAGVRRGVLPRPAAIPVGIDESVMVAGGSLYVYDIADGHNRISAYDLPSGHRRWAVPAVELATETTMTPVDGLIVVSMSDSDASGEHTVAFDARTGARRWTSDRGSATVVAGGVLVAAEPRDPGFNYPGTLSTTTYQLLDARTGSTRWQRAIPDDCGTQAVPAVAGLPPTLLQFCPLDATLTEIDLRTGTTLDGRTVDVGDPQSAFRVPEAYRMTDPTVTVVGDDVLIAHENVPTATVDAYALAGLARLWSDVPLQGQIPQPCGRYVCVDLDDGLSTGERIDPDTGRVIGSGSEADTAPPTAGAWVFLTGAGNVATLSVTGIPAVPAGTSVRIQPPRSGLPFQVTGTSMVLARWHGTARSSGTAAPAVDDMTTLRDVTAESCVNAAGQLICPTASGLAVWHLP